ncbi:hypothetical protein Esti_006416 [Eimeria stiedai]
MLMLRSSASLVNTFCGPREVVKTCIMAGGMGEAGGSCADAGSGRVGAGRHEPDVRPLLPLCYFPSFFISKYRHQAVSSLYSAFFPVCFPGPHWAPTRVLVQSRLRRARRSYTNAAFASVPLQLRPTASVGRSLAALLHRWRRASGCGSSPSQHRPVLPPALFCLGAAAASSPFPPKYPASAWLVSARARWLRGLAASERRALLCFLQALA